MSATFVGPAPDVVNGSGLTISQAFTIPAATDCAVAGLTYDGNAPIDVASITYGGQPMTPVDAGVNNATAPGQPFNYAQQFYLVAPPMGPNTLAVTFSTSTTDWYANIRGFAGVNPVVPIRAGSSVTNNGSSQAVGSVTLTTDIVIPSAADDITVSCFMPTSGNIASGSSQTLDGVINPGGSNSMGVDHATTPGADPVTHTWSSNAAVGNGVVFHGCSLNGDLTLTPPQAGPQRSPRRST